MRLELKDFAKAARSMHQQPGGIKRTRLMLHLRPYKTRSIFVLKATDGRTTLTTRVEHQGQIKQVEALIGDFVSECTRLSVPVAGAATTAAAIGNAASNEHAQSPPPADAAATSPSAFQRESGAGSKGGHAIGGQPNRQQQQQQVKASKQGNKGKKGKKH